MTLPDAYLTRVLEILSAPITMEAIHEYHAIAKVAKGDEVWMIDDLFETLFVATSTDAELFNQAIAEGLLL